jgi:hypothetical protein
MVAARKAGRNYVLAEPAAARRRCCKVMPVTSAPAQPRPRPPSEAAKAISPLLAGRDGLCLLHTSRGTAFRILDPFFGENNHDVG